MRTNRMIRVIPLLITVSLVVMMTMPATALAAEPKVNLRKSDVYVFGHADTPNPTGTLALDASGAYIVSVDAIKGYTKSYEGESDSSGNITLASGDDKTASNDIAISRDTNINNGTVNTPQTTDYSWTIIVASGICCLLLFFILFLSARYCSRYKRKNVNAR